jgi:hypothetical protein
LKELKAHRSADLNGLLVTLNDGSLCRQALLHWVSNGWLVVAPHSPLTALPGPSFRRDLDLTEFCGASGPAGPGEVEREESSDEDS